MQEIISAFGYDQNVYNKASPIIAVLTCITGLLYTKFYTKYPNQLLITERLMFGAIIIYVFAFLLCYAHISLYIFLFLHGIVVNMVTIGSITMNEEITKYCSIIFPDKTIYAIGALGIVNLPLNILMNLIISRLLDLKDNKYTTLASF